MATKKYISFNNLTNFFNNLKDVFATKIEMSAKSDKTHTHSISDIANLQSTLNEKANTSHGTHVTYSSTTPVMDGSASVGTASTVARSDHRHPSDTSRASQTSLDSHTSNSTSHITSTERANWNTAYTHSQTAHAPSGAEPNQNAFSNVKIGDITIAADIKTDTLTLVAGDNVTITPDASNDKITISAKDTTYTLGSFGINATATELNKLKGVTATTAEINYIDGVTSNIQTQLDNKVSTSRTINGKALSSNITLSAGDIGADVSGTAQTKADNALSSAKNYTDAKISALINSAPTTLDTLGEIATAMKENEDVVAALENSIGTKANTSDLTSHTSNKSNPHGVTIAQLGLGAAGSSLGLVKSGGDVTISSGVITINDDSHNHTIANIDNLQTSLDGKQATITGGASTITSSNLTANRALISNSSGKVAVSDITSTELGYLDGTTSNVQAQLDGRVKITNKSYSSFGTASTGTDGWYTLFTMNDNTSGSAICLLKGYAHSSVVFTVTKGYSSTASLNIIDCNTSLNNGYAYIKALRILSDGKVQAQINTGTVNISIHVISANGWISPVDSLVCDTSNPTVVVTRTMVHGKISAGGFVGDLTGNATTATTATNVAWSGVTSKPSYYDAKAIKGITRSGTTFTYTCMDGTTGTFTQQDNNTTYSAATTSANGLMSSSDKTKLDTMELATLAEVQTYLGI